MPRELHVFDFDGTLFRSPEPPEGFKGSWWWSDVSLSPPCVPLEPTGDWWVEDTVNAARASIDNPDVYTVMMTGRPDRSGFRMLIPTLLRQQGLDFDEVHLSNSNRTPVFKEKTITDILKRVPEIERVVFWDDNDSYMQGYKELVLGKQDKRRSVKMNLVTAEPKQCQTVSESLKLKHPGVTKMNAKRLRKILKEELGVENIAANVMSALLPEPVMVKAVGHSTSDVPEDCISAMRKVHDILRAQYHNYQTSHWQVMGTSFYGNHLLFQRLYGSVVEDIDGLGEKLVAYAGIDAVCPAASLECMLDCVEQWILERDHLKRGLKSEHALCESIDALYDSCDRCGFKMPRGLDDFMAALANAHETNKYLLRQAMSA
jgi:DNA-binding ferritin-like protein